jgi:hypothetical protein
MPRKPPPERRTGPSTGAVGLVLFLLGLALLIFDLAGRIGGAG